MPHDPWNPRSPHESVAGYVWLPRLLDKARRALVDPLTGHVSLDDSFMDTRFLKAHGLKSGQIVAWLREGLADAAIADRIAEHSGRGDADRETWSRRFTWFYKIGFVAIDADEGRRRPGPMTSVLRGAINAGFAIATS